MKISIKLLVAVLLSLCSIPVFGQTRRIEKIQDKEVIGGEIIVRFGRLRRALYPRSGKMRIQCPWIRSIEMATFSSAHGSAQPASCFRLIRAEPMWNLPNPI